MKYLNFQGQGYFGSTPPNLYLDTSRYGNHGVPFNSPRQIRLPSKLWYNYFLPGQGIIIGDIGLSRTLSFWLLLKEYTETETIQIIRRLKGIDDNFILEESPNNQISLNANKIISPNWNNCFINTKCTDTLTTGWQHIALTSAKDVYLANLTLGMGFYGGLALLAAHANELSLLEINLKFEAQRNLFGTNMPLKIEKGIKSLRKHYTPIFQGESGPVC